MCYPVLLDENDDAMRQLKARLGKFSQLQLMIDNEQLARGSAAALAVRMRSDAARVVEFATQTSPCRRRPPCRSRRSRGPTCSRPRRVRPKWARCRSLLVASEKMGQVVRLVSHGRRRSLQEGVQLLASMEEVDIPILFICRDIVRATDAAADAADAAGKPGSTQQAATAATEATAADDLVASD